MAQAFWNLCNVKLIEIEKETNTWLSRIWKAKNMDSIQPIKYKVLAFVS